MLKQRKIPTIFGVIVLVLGIVAGVFLVQSDKIFKTNASPEAVPQQVRITNITDTSFTVSWITDKQTQGFISFGQSNSLGISIQQQSTLPAGTFTHHVVVDNLKTQTTYYFKIGSGKDLFDNNGQNYQTKTATPLSDAPPQDIIFGNVNTDSGSPAIQTVVYLNILGVTPISALTDNQGKWSVPISTARNTSLSSFAKYSPDSTIEIFAQSGNNKIATAKIKVADAHPTPNIIIGQNHNFTNIKSLPNGELPTSQINIPSTTQTKASGFNVENQEKTSNKIEVKLTSLSDNESINTTKPQFIGSGTPNTILNLKLESPSVYTKTLTIDQKGNWGWTAPQNLSPGSHTLTISWKDDVGQTQSLIRMFTVLAQGSSNLPAFTASSSGVGSETTATPTTTPKATPTTTPTPSPASTISTSEGIPQPGNLTASLSLFIMGMILILAGMFFPKIRG